MTRSWRIRNVRVVFSVRVHDGWLDAADGDRFCLSTGNGHPEVDVASGYHSIGT